MAGDSTPVTSCTGDRLDSRALSKIAHAPRSSPATSRAPSCRTVVREIIAALRGPGCLLPVRVTRVISLAGTSHLDTYLDTASGALLAQGQVLRIRRRDGASDALLRDLRYWHTREVTAVPTSPPSADEVGFGSTVLVRIKGRERRYTLVGDDEAEPAAGLIAWSAPLARALMGAMAGESIAFAGDSVEVLTVD